MTDQPWSSQRDHERSRTVVEGTRTDDGTVCTLVVVHRTTGHWHLYPHGWGTFGVSLDRAAAREMAQAILDGTG